MGTYYFMIGIPGSGKSGLAEALAVSQGCQVVCPDTIRDAHCVGSPESFAIAYREIGALLREGKNVVFDATNTIRRHRAEMIAAGKPYADEVVCIWMDTPLEVCIARHHERVRQGIRTTLPDEVIVRMSKQLEADPPDPSEGFDEIIRIKYEEEEEATAPQWWRR